jgi:hypothetical protein
MSESEKSRWSLSEIHNKIRRRTGYFKRQYIREYPNIKDVVFLWIPKNGGTSMYNALKPFGMQYLTNEAALRFYFPNKGMVSFGPLNYSYLLNNNRINSGFHQSAFKFAITRNPFDRAVSSFFYFKDKKWIHPKMGFKEFTWHISKIKFEDVGATYNTYEGYLYPQLCYISHNEQVCVDYLARLESIHQDIEVIKNHLNLDFSFPHLNPTVFKSFEHYYCNETRKRISDIYERDFEQFDYPKDF